MANIVKCPEEYAWTSHHGNAWADQGPLNSAPESYLALGQDQVQRHSNYRQLAKTPLTAEECAAIREAFHYSMPLDSEKYTQQIEEKIGPKTAYAQRGRPHAKLVKNKSLRPFNG